jgi:hypothetical protein
MTGATAVAGRRRIPPDTGLTRRDVRDWSMATLNEPARDELDRSQSLGGEIGELNLRYSYEPQSDSLNSRVMPVPREQPPFAPKHRLAAPVFAKRCLTDGFTAEAVALRPRERGIAMMRSRTC